MDTPAIDLSTSTAFGATLIGASAIKLVLYLRGSARRAYSNKHRGEDTLQNTYLKETQISKLTTGYAVQE